MCLKKPKKVKNPAQAVAPDAMKPAFTPTLLGGADTAAAMNPLTTLPSTILSGAEFDAAQAANAQRADAVAAGAAADAADLKAKTANPAAKPAAWATTAANLVTKAKKPAKVL